MTDGIDEAYCMHDGRWWERKIREDENKMGFIRSRQVAMHRMLYIDEWNVIYFQLP